jgi:hypothetical protein
MPFVVRPELGRPRIDVVCNLSGIFRDSFQNVVELLDDLFQVLPFFFCLFQMSLPGAALSFSGKEVCQLDC